MHCPCMYGKGEGAEQSEKRSHQKTNTQRHRMGNKARPCTAGSENIARGAGGGMPERKNTWKEKKGWNTARSDSMSEVMHVIGEFPT